MLNGAAPSSKDKACSTSTKKSLNISIFSRKIVFGKSCQILVVNNAPKIFLGRTYNKQLLSMFFFKKWANPASFSFIFGLFKQTIQFLQQINVKNVVSIQNAALGFKPTTSRI